MSKSGGWGPTKGLHPPPPTAPAQEDLSHDAIAQKISLCGAGSSSQAAHSLGGAEVDGGVLEAYPPPLPWEQAAWRQQPSERVGGDWI